MKQEVNLKKFASCFVFVGFFSLQQFCNGINHSMLFMLLRSVLSCFHVGILVSFIPGMKLFFAHLFSETNGLFHCLSSFLGSFHRFLFIF